MPGAAPSIDSQPLVTSTSCPTLFLPPRSGRTSRAASASSRRRAAIERRPFSITDWALDIFQELDLEYDPLVFPIAPMNRYGRPCHIDARKGIAEVRPGLYEIVVSTLRIGNLGVPWAGAGYFRLLPERLFAHGIRRILESGRSYVSSIPPWEIDPEQPRMRGLKPAHKFRHTTTWPAAKPRFARLLNEFQWTTVAELLASIWLVERRRRKLRAELLRAGECDAPRTSAFRDPTGLTDNLESDSPDRAALMAAMSIRATRHHPTEGEGAPACSGRSVPSRRPARHRVARATFCAP
jgi:hypothetical protein